MAGPIRISILANASQAKRELDGVAGSTNSLGSKFAKFGKVAALGVAVAGAAAVKFAATSMKSLARIETINAQTANAIKSTGGAAGVSAKHVEKLAGRLENLTASEAEATQEGANLLLTFTNIQNKAGRGNKIFDQTTRTMVDMSRALGQDTKSSAMQLGKALNDPIKGVGALSRVGVSFTQQQKDQIKTLTESGNTLGAQKVILRELNKEFGGSGKAFAATTTGKIELAKHAFGTLGETLMTGLLPPLGKAAEGMTKFLGYLDANVGPALNKVKTFIEPVVSAFQALFAGMGEGSGPMSALSDFFQNRLRPAIEGIVTAFQGWLAVVIPIVQQVVQAIVGNWSKIAPYVTQIFNAVKTIISGALQIVAQVVRRITQVISFVWKKWGADITRFVVMAFTKIAQIVGGLMKAIAGVIKVVLSVLKGDWRGAWNGMKQIVSGVWQAIKGIVSGALNVIKGIVRGAWAVVKALTSAAWNGIKSAVTTGVNNAVNAVQALPGKIKGFFSGAASWLYSAGRDIIGGLISGITSMIGSVTSKLGELTSKIPDWKGPAAKDKKLLRPVGRLIMQGLIRGFGDGEKGIKKALGRITKMIGNTVKEVQDLKKKSADYAKSVADNALGFGSVTNLNTAFSADAMIQQMRARLDKVREFQGMIADLAAKGLNKTTLDQLVQAGVEGGMATAQALAAGGAGSIKEINSIQNQMGDAAKALGKTGADSMYQAGLTAAQALLKGLRDGKKSLAKVLKWNKPRQQAVARYLNNIKPAQRQQFVLAAAGGTNKTTQVVIQVNVPPTADKAAIGREVAGALDAFYAQGGRRRS